MNEIILSNGRMPLVASCDFCVTPEPFFHADRVLPFHVLIFVTGGEISVTETSVTETSAAEIRGTETRQDSSITEVETDYTIHAGELLFLKAGQHHFGKYIIPRGTKWYFVHFYSEWNEQSEPFSKNVKLQETWGRKEYFMKLPKKLSGLEGTAMEQKMDEFTQYYHSKQDQKAWSINQKLFDLLTYIAFWDASEEKSQTIGDQICDYLKQQCHTNFSASLLEQHFYLSYKRMAAVFKKEKQITMQQYHTNLRMEAAGNLLKTTLLPIGEISEQMGFSDMLYFSRCFHAVYGMSPTEYRKSRIKNY